MGNITDVVVIGAGPYGLSIGAHLQVRRVDFRIFGHPMSSWRNHMGAGTYLKSFGFASSLYLPDQSFTLRHFCEEKGLPYSDSVEPVSLSTFIDYGLEFQRRFVPTLEQTDITHVESVPEGFAISTASGERFLTRRVVVAAGITHFGYTPAALEQLPGDRVSHSSEHTDLTPFRGLRVAVVGAGASAADTAGLLHEAGAETHLIVRSNDIKFNDPPPSPSRPVLRRMLKPRSGLGYGWRGRLAADLPILFRKLPVETRFRQVKAINGPAGGWFSRDKVVGRVKVHAGYHVEAAQMIDGKVRLHLAPNGALAPSAASGSSKLPATLEFDHVIAATGYRVDVTRLRFLDPEILAGIKTISSAPILSSNFETSVPGLYMVGLASASTFGPLCRFAYGAKFTAARIARHLAATASRHRRSA